MGYEQDAVNQMFSLTMNGVALAVEVMGKLTPQILHFFAATYKCIKNKGGDFIADHSKKGREIPFLKLMRRGNGVEAFDIREEDLEKFRAAAKGTPIYFYVGTVDKTHKEGERIMTVYVGPDDVPYVNRIIEHNNLNVVKSGSTKTQEIDPEVAKDIPPIPGAEKVENVEYADSWGDFFGPDGEVDTPEANKAKREAAQNVRPTQPESSEKAESPSKSSSGQQKSEKTAEKPLAYQTVGSDFNSFTESIDEQNRVREQAKANEFTEKTNEVAQVKETVKVVQADKTEPLKSEKSAPTRTLNLAEDKSKRMSIYQRIENIKKEQADKKPAEPEKLKDAAKSADKGISI